MSASNIFPPTITTAGGQGRKGPKANAPLLLRSPALLQIILCSIILLAFLIRIWDTANLRMWGDEGFSVYSANRDLYAITFEGKDIDPHPPLYYYLLHFWLPLGGFSELSIRFFSVFFGTATVALAYAIAARMFDKRAGILAALILAIAPFAVQYSQEVRMYALVMFLGSIALWFFVQLISNPKPPVKHWLGFFVAVLLTQYSLYQAAFIFVAQGIFLTPFFLRDVSFRSKREISQPRSQDFSSLKTLLEMASTLSLGFILRWLAVSCSVVVLFVPWLLAHSGSAFTDVKDVAGETVPMNLVAFLARGFSDIAIGPKVPASNAPWLAGMFALVIILGLSIAVFTRRTRINDWLLVAFVAIPMLSLYPIYFLAPLYRGRLFALAFVPLMLLLARCVLFVVERTRVMAIPLALLIVGTAAYSLNNYYFNYDRYSAVVEDYLPAIQNIEQRAQAGDMILFHAYWHQGYFLSHYAGVPLDYRALEKQRDLEAAVAQPRTVWAIVQALAHHDAENWLSQNAFYLSEEKFGQMRVLMYRTGTPARGENFATPIVFDNGMQLRGYHINDTPIESGRGIVTLQLDWQAAQKIPTDYKVSVRLTNGDGSIVWAQDDNQPSNGTQPTSTWDAGQTIIDHRAFVVPPGTPPGTYSARVVVYDSASGRASNIVAPDNMRGQAAAAGQVTISKSNVAAVVTPPVTMNARWNEIALSGFDVVAEQIGAGDALPLTLYWRAEQKPARDYLAEIQIVDAGGTTRASTRFAPANNFATSLWQVRDTLLDKLALTIAADAAPGEEKIIVRLIDASTNQIVAPGTVELARIQINARAHRFTLPSPLSVVTATLGNQIKFLGYDLNARMFKPRESIALTLYWQALGSMRERNTVFVHVLDAQGNIIAQRDSEPGNRDAPTTSWLAGEVITDEHVIALPPNIAPNEYTLVIGMYQPATGVRLTVTPTQADRIILTSIRVTQ